MQPQAKKAIVIAVCALILAAGIALLVYTHTKTEPIQNDQTATSTPSQQAVVSEVLGTSVQGRAIEAYTYGTGPKRLVFVGGIHGGYEWNSVLLAYQAMDYFEANAASIPSALSITIIPSANPDGVFKVIGKEGRFSLADVPANEGPVGNGRFNANNVDLNRNFGCKWKPTSMWRGTEVSAGTAAFSEPEAAALRDFMVKTQPVATVFWHSQANAVYASECEAGILPQTLTLMNTYATAAGYAAVSTFDAYEVTGDIEGWLASIGIPAITVELATHATVEWEKNLQGVLKTIELYSK